MKKPAVIYDEKAQCMADAMIAAEARHIARRKAKFEDCDCKEGMFPTAGVTDRRKFLFAAGSSLAGVAGAASLAQAQDKAPPGAIHFNVPADPTKEQGRAVNADGGYGSRSQFEIGSALALPDRERKHIVEHDAARQDARQSHRVGVAL